MDLNLASGVIGYRIKVLVATAPIKVVMAYHGPFRRYHRRPQASQTPATVSPWAPVARYQIATATQLACSRLFSRFDLVYSEPVAVGRPPFIFI